MKFCFVFGGRYLIELNHKLILFCLLMAKKIDKTNKSVLCLYVKILLVLWHNSLPPFHKGTVTSPWIFHFSGSWIEYFTLWQRDVYVLRVRTHRTESTAKRFLLMPLVFLDFSRTTFWFPLLPLSTSQFQFQTVSNSTTSFQVLTQYPATQHVISGFALIKLRCLLTSIFISVKIIRINYIVIPFSLRN